MLNSGMLSSQTGKWDTPRSFLDLLGQEFEITTDPCASLTSAVEAKFRHYESDNGLEQVWHGITFVNPPYGRGLIKWIEKGISSGVPVIYLLPARTDTKWFDLLIKHADFVGFWRGRLRFGKATNPAPFPSMIACIDPSPHRSAIALALKDLFKPFCTMVCT